MLDVKEATKVVNDSLPGWKIDAIVDYNNLYLFRVFSDRPFEEEMDPFFSVDKETGEFSDFSIITDGNTSEILSLFQKAKPTSI
jgi:hypothetical protein